MTFIFVAYVTQEYEVLSMNKAEIEIVNSPPTFLFITTPFTPHVWKKGAKRWGGGGKHILILALFIDKISDTCVPVFVLL